MAAPPPPSAAPASPPAPRPGEAGEAEEDASSSSGSSVATAIQAVPPPPASPGPVPVVVGRAAVVGGVAGRPPRAGTARPKQPRATDGTMAATTVLRPINTNIGRGPTPPGGTAAVGRAPRTKAGAGGQNASPGATAGRVASRTPSPGQGQARGAVRTTTPNRNGTAVPTAATPSSTCSKTRRTPPRTAMARVSTTPRLPLGPASMDLTRFTTSAHGHPETGGALSRVIMVRKTEQRVFTSLQGSEIPKVETLTRETVETFRGNRTQRKVTTCQKRDGSIAGDLAELRSAMSSGYATPRTGLTSGAATPYTPYTAGGSTGTATPLSSASGMASSGASTADPSRRSPSSSPDRPGSRASHVSRASSSSSTATTAAQRLCKSKSRSLSDGESCFGEDFAQDFLRTHNEYRARHGVVPLKLSKKLSRYSEEWAKRLASRGVIEHRNDSDYGENIFCSWSSSPSHTVAGDEPVHHWYSEIKDHKFGKEPTSLKTGHFTQVVWKDSRELGVAVARSRTGQVFVVANYSPPGNFVGCFAENVPPVGGFPQTAGSALSPVREGVEAGGSEDLAQEGLRLHNEYRRLHGVPALRLSPQLCEYARDWARTLAREDRFAHRPDGRYGENIFCAWSPDSGTGPGSSSRVGAKEACETWYKEIKEHPFGQEPRLLKSGHFSQMIWKESKELGLGMARSKNGRTLIVANYHPRGNYIGQFAENVPRPSSGPHA